MMLQLINLSWNVFILSLCDHNPLLIMTGDVGQCLMMSLPVFRCLLCWRTSWAACWLVTLSSARAPPTCWSTRSCCRPARRAAWCPWWSSTANACRSADTWVFTWGAPDNIPVIHLRLTGCWEVGSQSWSSSSFSQVTPGCWRLVTFDFQLQDDYPESADVTCELTWEEDVIREQ